jgi:hypothetical protein
MGRVASVVLALVASIMLIGESWSQQALRPLGVFSAVRTTDDHAYGQKVKLWANGSLLAGEVMYWDASPEAQRGRFTDGHFDRSSGNVRFKVLIVRQDVLPNTRAEAVFAGALARGGLVGKLTWQGEAAKTRGRNGVEDWVLRYDKSEPLESFAGVDAWQRAHAQ